MESATLKDLIEILTNYLNKYPEQGNKMIYFKGTHIKGKLIDQVLTLELH